MKTIFTFLICLVIGGNCMAQTFQPDRIIYWVHGLAGNLHSWGPVATVTEFQTTPITGYPARNIHSAAMYYDDATASTLNGAAKRVDDYMHALNISPDWINVPTTEHFIIAHSQGGLVARTIDGLRYQASPPYPREFGGLVTFGTTHQGAAIIDNAQPNGMLEQWLKEGCRAIGYAEIQDKVSDHWLTSIALPPGVVAGIVDEGCGVFEQTILANLINGIRLPLTQDYMTDANHLEDLQNVNHSIPIVLFYGEEKQPVLWRTVASFIFNPSYLTNNPFGADSDDWVIPTVNNYISKYNQRRKTHDRIANQYNNAAWITGFTLNPVGVVVFGSLARKHRAISYRYTDARDWLSSGNRNWERIIGAMTTHFESDGYDCICFGVNGLTTTWVENEYDCTGAPGTGWCKTYPRRVKVHTHKPNDGVVLAESAAVLPDAIFVEDMPETNHMQMRNCTQTKYALKKLLDGEIANAGYFECDER